MGRFCENCGAQLNENQVVCLKCGTIVSKEKPVAKNRPGNFVLNASIYNTALLLMTFFTFIGLAFYIVKIDYMSIIEIKVTGFSIITEYPRAIQRTGMAVSVYCLLHVAIWVSIVLSLLIYSIVVIIRSGRYTKEESNAYIKKKLFGQSNLKLISAILLLLMSMMYMIMASIAVDEVSGNFNSLYYSTMAYGMFIADLLLFVPFLVTDIIMRKNKTVGMSTADNIARSAEREHLSSDVQKNAADPSSVTKTQVFENGRTDLKEDTRPAVNEESRTVAQRPSNGWIVAKVVNDEDGAEKIMRLADNVKSSAIVEKLVSVFGLAEVGDNGEKIKYAFFMNDEYDQIDLEFTLAQAGVKQRDTLYIRKALLEI